MITAMKHGLSALLTLLCLQPAFAQQVDVERYVREHQAAIVREFMELVAIPNVRTDLPNIKRNAEQLRQRTPGDRCYANSPVLPSL